MKKLLKITSVLAIFALIFASCQTTEEDDPAAYPLEGGAYIKLSGDGKLLGTPNDPTDLDNSLVTLTDAQAELMLTVDVPVGNSTQGVQSYELTKTFNGVETVVAQSATLPFTLTYSTVAEFLAGTGAVESDLRIGDQFIFNVRNILTDGSVTQAGAAGTFIITVNCLSDLAGTYTSSNGETVTITEVQAGVYESTQLPYLTSGGNPIPFQFSESCGTITINTLVLGSYLTVGTGVVNDDGTFTISYVLYDGSSVDAGILFDFSGPGDVVTYTP